MTHIYLICDAQNKEIMSSVSVTMTISLVPLKSF